MFIQDWLNKKLKYIAKALPQVIEEDAYSFEAGFMTGYKAALLGLEEIINDGAKLRTSNCWCGDKFHGQGARCL